MLGYAPFIMMLVFSSTRPRDGDSRSSSQVFSGMHGMQSVLDSSKVSGAELGGLGEAAEFETGPARLVGDLREGLMC